ncbi:MAG: tetratricopeptide repeat protein [Leptolyngbya sp. BL-A-14]
MATASELLTLAMQHHQAGQLSDAERLYRDVLQHEPHQARALYLLGLLAHQVGHLDAAIAYYEQALAFQPDYLEAHNNLGAARQQQGNLVDAIAHYQTVLRLKPENPNANINLGVALQKQGKLDAAIARYQKAIRLDGSLPEAHSNLGHALKERGDFELAIVHYRTALQLAPQNPDAHRNLAEALQEQGQTDEAIALLDHALTLHPDHTQLQGSRIRARLSSGHLREGFAEYDPWRLARSTRSFSQPAWDGSELNGARILLYAEPGAGFGDTLQFVRYAPLVAQRGGRVIVECQEPLLRLLKTVQGIDALVAAGEPLPAFDLQASLLSLPFLFATTLETIPVHVPYVSAPVPGDITADLAPIINDQKTQKCPLQVGLVWGGDPNHLHDQERSCPLSAFSAFLTTPGVTFYSLQKGVHRLELVNNGALPIHDWHDRLTDFADTAVAIEQLDLVISVDTAVAHLAGAMAKPVWVLLPFASDWRWMMQCQTSPWYPTAQLFRQLRPQDWVGVCTQVAQALNHLVKL